MKKRTKKPLAAERKRLKRNAASRAWKKANPAKVAKWNKDWQLAQKKKKSKKRVVKPDTVILASNRNP
jgi:hypothetical protein